MGPSLTTSCPKRTGVSKTTAIASIESNSIEATIAARTRSISVELARLAKIQLIKRREEVDAD